MTKIPKFNKDRAFKQIVGHGRKENIKLRASAF